MNFSDSERIASFLEKSNFKPISDINKADLVIFNTCGIRQMAEDRVYGQIRNLRIKNKKCKIILTGCVAHRKDVQRRLKYKVDLFCSIKEFVEKATLLLVVIDDTTLNYLKIKPKYSNKFSANVPIMTGCNNFCAYCVVPYARGREISRPAKEIIKEVKTLIKKDYKEITLLGQNVNSYKDNKINFTQLLKKINALPGNFWIRFMSSHPKDMSNELIETVTSLKKVCENIHLPIQAGDNTVLNRMDRKYTSAHYLKLIKKIKDSFDKNKPNKVYSLSTDIIVGFPGETKKQFLKSEEIMKKVGYDMVYFGQFSPRPGTAAWEMDDNITKKEKVAREMHLNEILKKSAYANNKKYVGKIFDVLIENEKNGFYYGKTRTFKNVKVTIPQDCHPRLDPGSRKNKREILKQVQNDKIENQNNNIISTENLIGKFAKAKIIKANAWSLEGGLVK